MNDPHPTDTAPDSFSDLPIQPTGSGVADLEIAYEQMKLAAGEETGTARADEATDSPTDGSRDDAAESEGHPS